MVPSVKMLRNTGDMTGHVALRLANLAARGYIVVPISCADWRAMEMVGVTTTDKPDSGVVGMRHPFESVDDARERFLIDRLVTYLPDLQGFASLPARTSHGAPAYELPEVHY